jgi:hypothetical protein
MIRKENLVLTYASGPVFNTLTFWVFINSFKNISNADLVVLTNNIDTESRSKIINRGFEVVDVPEGEAFYLFRDRHLHFYNYLNKHGHKYNNVLITDSRDVVFQANPFDWIDIWKNRINEIKGDVSFLNHFVIFTSEGFRRSESGFACIEHFEFQRDVPMPHLKNDNSKFVCNAGVTLGTPRAIQDYEFLMFMTSMKTIGRCTDQASLNYMLHFLADDKTYQISFPQHDNLCLTGEGVKVGSVEPILIDGKLFNPKNELYFMIHQWDRLDGLREEILSQYSE